MKTVFLGLISTIMLAACAEAGSVFVDTGTPVIAYVNSCPSSGSWSFAVHGGAGVILSEDESVK